MQQELKTLKVCEGPRLRFSPRVEDTVRDSFTCRRGTFFVRVIILLDYRIIRYIRGGQPYKQCTKSMVMGMCLDPRSSCSDICSNFLKVNQSGLVAHARL